MTLAEFEYILDKIKSLEDSVQLLREHVYTKQPDLFEKSLPLIPDNFMTASNFSKKYKFITNGCVTDWISKNKEFFEGNWIRKDREVMVNPVTVIRFIYSSNGSTRAINSINKLIDVIPDLKELIDKSTRE